MRFLSADYIFPISADPIKNGILVLDDDDSVVEVLHPENPNFPSNQLAERYTGAICPGFVNAHCHLELSHMKGVVPEKTGLPAFVMDIVSKRQLNADKKVESIVAADTEMWENGIQAVGDICNTADTLDTKRDSKIYYHSFVEVFSFDSSKADEVLTEGIRVASAYNASGLSASIVPHAPYSVSPKLFAGIANQQNQFAGTISMHNQETPSENEMFVSASGDLVELFKKFGEDFSDFNPEFKSSLDYALPLISKHESLILVHNTLTQKPEMEWVCSQRDNVFWCTCPSANLYIENRLPALLTWFEVGAKICIGTDSLASNHQLSILEELKVLAQHFPSLELQQLLKIGTLNGAEALQLDNRIGSFEKGKGPGVVLIEGIDPEGQALSGNVTCRRLV